MNVKRLWCRACNKIVEVAIEESASAIIAPLVVGTAGGAIGKAKGGWEAGLVGAFIGLAAGAFVHAMIPKAQRVVCSECSTHIG